MPGRSSVTTDTYDVSVQTLIERADGRLFADLGTMRWFGVDEDMRTWLAGSCKATAFWLMELPEALDGESPVRVEEAIDRRREEALRPHREAVAEREKTADDISVSGDEVATDTEDDHILFSQAEILALKLMFSLFDR